MFFPSAELVIFFLTFVLWAERNAARGFFLLLTIAWLIGDCLENFLRPSLIWHWHLARLAVMAVFWFWAWLRAERRVFPLFSASLTVIIETLFRVNEPGAFPFEPWVFTLVLILVCWLTAKSYWGTAAAFVGSLLINQAFVRFAFNGLVNYMDLPEGFIWNFGVGFLTLAAGLSLGWQYCAQRGKLKPAAEPFSASEKSSCEDSQESDGGLE